MPICTHRRTGTLVAVKPLHPPNHSAPPKAAQSPTGAGATSGSVRTTPVRKASVYAGVPVASAGASGCAVRAPLLTSTSASTSAGGGSIAQQLSRTSKRHLQQLTELAHENILRVRLLPISRRAILQRSTNTTRQPPLISPLADRIGSLPDSVLRFPIVLLFASRFWMQYSTVQ